MPGFAIKNLRADLHRKLKAQAIRHHSTMTKEVLVVLERALNAEDRPQEVLTPFKGRFASTDQFITQAQRGRE
jgi:plasmid stability protein